MFRIRFHGRGGQGIKVASRILGTAFFLEGYQVQDAPRYGAERRGAPIFAYVRADRRSIHERGVVTRPDLVVVADDSLVALPAAEVQQGWQSHTLVLIRSGQAAAWWQRQLPRPSKLLILPTTVPLRDALHRLPVGTLCAAAAAQLCGVISRQALMEAVNEELADLAPAELDDTLRQVVEVFDHFAKDAAAVQVSEPRQAEGTAAKIWIELPLDGVERAAPVIRKPASSEAMATGLWRTERPQLARQRCRRCGQCAILCPEGVITMAQDGYPQFDYDHCKGCMICVEQCPVQAIDVVDERQEGGEVGR
ncbi:MAG: 2-oxoacid:acceptor oxidoreductase family protein [Desulfuromonas sp.]|nr:2-oxoacid:acceptor oxidoreductase family protein [Desulfuromonas sp.]